MISDVTPSPCIPLPLKGEGEIIKKREGGVNAALPLKLSGVYILMNDYSLTLMTIILFLIGSTSVLIFSWHLFHQTASR